jgi:hypothetical protein
VSVKPAKTSRKTLAPKIASLVSTPTCLLTNLPSIAVVLLTVIYSFLSHAFSWLLAIEGTILVWFPFVATVALSAAGSIQDRVPRFDYLMPAELFPVALLGGGLLVWAAIRARSHRRVLGWSLATAIGLLVGGQVLAVATGLASGAADPTGWRIVLVAASIGGYSLALVTMGAGGASLVRALFKRGPLADSTAPERG